MTASAPVSDLLTREGTIAPSASGDEQIADAIISAGAEVARRDWDGPYTEKLRMTARAIKMDRLQNGASVLDTHHAYSLSDVVGHIVKGSVRLEKGKLHASIKVTDDSVWAKVAAGSVNALSVQYRVLKWQITKRTSRVPEYRLATEWEPLECSFVPYGADPEATVQATRSIDGGETMATQLEEFETIARKAKMPSGTARAWTEAKLSREQVQTLALDHVRARNDADGGEGPHGINVISDGEDLELAGRHQAMVDAVLHRSAPESFPLENPRSREFAGMTLFELARSCVGRAARGLRDRNRIMSAALDRRTGGMLTTGDFPAVLGDSFSKMLQREYAEATPTFEPICRRTQAPDFKNINSIALGDAPELLEIQEHGEIQHGAISEGKETYRVKEFGRTISITRKALINDDRSAFSRIPRMMAVRARDLESDLVWTEITANRAMADTKAVFHLDHGNLAAVNAAVTVNTLGIGHASMRKQKGLDGRIIDIRPEFLVVPVAKEIAALKVVSSITPKSADDVNPFSTLLTVIAEPRLDSANAASWYMAASAQQLDIIELATLESGGPMVETRVGFDVSGIEIKVTHDAGAKILDFRGLFKNTGL